jgi:hypothetical protein
MKTLRILAIVAALGTFAVGCASKEQSTHSSYGSSTTVTSK